MVFSEELKKLIENCNIDKASGTPSHVLMQFMLKTLDTLESAVADRDAHRRKMEEEKAKEKRNAVDKIPTRENIIIKEILLQLVVRKFQPKVTRVDVKIHARDETVVVEFEFDTLGRNRLVHNHPLYINDYTTVNLEYLRMVARHITDIVQWKMKRPT
jgi:hypothetical protein